MKRLGMRKGHRLGTGEEETQKQEQTRNVNRNVNNDKPLTATELLRKQQDKEYEESLKDDRKKENQKQEKEDKEKKQKQEEEEFLKKLIASMPEEPSSTNTNALRVGIKLPNGKRLTRRFEPNNTLMVILLSFFSLLI
jgi:FAS-associated factor 2